MSKLMILLFILIALFFLFQVVKKPALSPEVSGTGPGYIPAFQGHPEIGVKS